MICVDGIDPVLDYRDCRFVLGRADRIAGCTVKGPVELLVLHAADWAVQRGPNRGCLWDWDQLAEALSCSLRMARNAIFKALDFGLLRIVTADGVAVSIALSIRFADDLMPFLVKAAAARAAALELERRQSVVH